MARGRDTDNPFPGVDPNAPSPWLLERGFQDWASQFLNNSEGAGGDPAQLRAFWDQMSDEDKWGVLKGGFAVSPGEPGYDEWAERLGVPDDRRWGSINFTQGDPSYMGRDVLRYNDPGRVYRGPGFHVDSMENWTPDYSDRTNPDGDPGSDFWKNGAMIIASLLGGAYFTGGFGAAGATGAEGLLAAAPGEGFGTAAAGAGAEAGLGAEAGAGLLGEGSPGWAAEGGGSLGSEGLLGEGNVPGWGLEGGAGLDGAPVTELSRQAAPRGVLGNLAAGEFGEAAGSLGTWAMNNPLQALGAGQTLAGLLGGAGGGGGSGRPGGRSGGPGGGLGGGGKLTRPNWSPNPYLLAQIKRYGGV